MSVGIAPSILASDFSRLAQQLEEVEEAGAEVVHLDVMDGRFVPNITLGPPVVAACRRSTDLPLDVHLMIEEPERFVEAFADAGADLLTIHAEATPHVHRALQLIRDAGMQAGLAVNPLTPLAIYEDAMLELDLVLIMSVNPGFGGQTFLPRSLDRIERVRKLRDRLNPSCRIEVDGGINADTAGPAVRAGADLLVAGSAIFNPHASIEANIRMLRKAIA